VQFKHQGKVQYFGSFATAEEAAWEQDLKRLEQGYEDEGFYNYKLQLGQGNTTEEYNSRHLSLRDRSDTISVPLSDPFPSEAPECQEDKQDKLVAVAEPETDPPLTW
jgi:hypothetical protein